MTVVMKASTDCGVNRGGSGEGDEKWTDSRWVLKALL